MDILTRKINRADLAKVFPDHKTLVAFENLQDDVTNSGGVFSTAGFVTVAADVELGAERVLTGSANVSVHDGGAGNAVTLDLTDTAVSPGAHGDASHVIQITVDTKGRLTGVQVFALDTSNITEGSKLFYTDARARAAISGVGGVSYNSSTGVIDTTGFTGTVSPVASITVANGIVTAVS